MHRPASVLGGIAVVHRGSRIEALLCQMYNGKRNLTGKNRRCGILLTAQVLVGCLAVAQADTSSEHEPARAVSLAPVMPSSIGRTNLVIAITPRSLEFGSVATGSSKKLSFTVQNCGLEPLSGHASVSEPFSIVDGSPFNVGKSGSQVITVQYAPRTAGMNITVIRLKGDLGGTVTVMGSAFSRRPAAPIHPAAPRSRPNLRFIAKTTPEPPG